MSPSISPAVGNTQPRCGSTLTLWPHPSQRRRRPLRTRIREREVVRDLTYPEVVHFTVGRRHRQLEHMPIPTKPRLTNVPKHGIMAHKAHRRGAVIQGKLHDLIHGHRWHVVPDACGCERSSLVVRRDIDLQPHSDCRVLYEYDFAPSIRE